MGTVAKLQQKWYFATVPYKELQNYMESLLVKLGVDWKLLLAQMVNFLALLVILYKFLYKPVLKILRDREEKIEKSLKQAEQIEKNLFESQAEKDKILQQARGEAGRIILESKQTAEKMHDKIANEAKLEAQNILEQGKRQMEAEKEIMFKEIKKDIAYMVKTAAEKILREKIKPDNDVNFIEKNLDNLK